MTCALALALPNLPANDSLPGAPQASPVLLRGGTVHPVAGEPFEGFVLFAGGTIIGLGPGDGAGFEGADDARVIELEGRHVYPGMIAANSALGLTEIRAVRASLDVAEVGGINPNARAEVAVDPDSELIPVTRSNGVLHALAVPQARGLIGGTSALMALDGWTWEQMAARAPVGMHLRWPAAARPPGVGGADAEAAKKSREAAAEARRDLRAAFDSARAYLDAKAAGVEGARTDLRWEAMASVFAGEVPLFVHADRLGEIGEAVRFCAERDLAMVLVGGGADVARAAPLLKRAGVPVIISAVNDLPGRRWEAYDAPMRVPLALHEAGVTFCIAGRGNTFSAANERNLPYEAARAAAFGLPRAEALKAVTLSAAQILGVGERLGSLESGKEATLIVTDGDPLEVTTRVERAFIAGREVDLSNKQTRLYEKYREKYRRGD